MKLAVISLGVSAAAVLFLVYGPFVHAIDAYFYWMLCWSQFFWEPIFPPLGGVSAPSEKCYAAMLVTDILLLAMIIYCVLLLIRCKFRK